MTRPVAPHSVRCCKTSPALCTPKARSPAFKWRDARLVAAAVSFDACTAVDPVGSLRGRAAAVRAGRGPRCVDPGGVAVPIGDDLAAAIAADNADGYLFPGDEDGHLSPRWVGKLMAGALPDHWTAHTLRHRFATRAYRGSRNLRAVQTLLGHSSVATTERYTAVDDDEIRAAMMAALDDHATR
jgi:hypothetical protein